jgi:FkbM family methyltransferase
MSHNNWVEKLGLDVDGSLFVELENGIRFYDLCLNARLPNALIIHPDDLTRPENRQLYYCFLRTLNEIAGVMYSSLYEGSYGFKRGDVVLDAGARIGVFTAKVSGALGRDGKIIAIEPEPRNYACLRKNVETNRLQNVIPIQRMLWSRKQQMSLFLSSNSASHSVYCDEFYGLTGESIGVEAEALDDILESLHIQAVDFIKMDIEGSEIEALKGMKRVLESDVQLAIAAYHPVRGSETHTEIVPQLERLGFKPVCLEGIVHASRRRNESTVEGEGPSDPADPASTQRRRT